jgi:uncharacterized protein (TIGR03083 family)
MEMTTYIEALRRDGALLADAAVGAGLDAPVPPCPDWRIRDLVRHCGAVHRWASEIVATAAPDLSRIGGLSAVHPDDSDLVEWFREGHAGLVSALENAPDDLECFTFIPGWPARAFWARRQAHETAIHRADAESPAGSITPVEPALAADGIDELVMGFIPRRGGRLRSDTSRSLAIEPTDAAGGWRLEIGDEGTTSTRGTGPADTTVRGHASDLFLLVWNRRGAEGIEVIGDASTLDLWRSLARI